MDAVHGYERTVNQLMGDGIMALLGAPIAHEDHGFPGRNAACAHSKPITMTVLPLSIPRAANECRLVPS
jgi:class 3 adenylate cyclase